MSKWFVAGLALPLFVAASVGTRPGTPAISDAVLRSHFPVASVSGPSCADEASADCTPRVAWDQGHVRVGGLLWAVKDVRATKTIGSATQGGNAARGMFVVAQVKVRSKLGETADVTDGTVSLRVGDRTYNPDLDGTVAAIGDGRQPLFLRQLRAGSTTTATVVFDVPTSALRGSARLRFSDLESGRTRAYVDLPPLAA